MTGVSTLGQALSRIDLLNDHFLLLGSLLCVTLSEVRAFKPEV